MAAGAMSELHEVRTLEFRGIGGERLKGWVASPDAPALPARAFLWLQPYGRESVLPNQYGTREGFASMSFNFFGEEPFHREKYGAARGYFAQGVHSKEDWIFRSMYQNAVIASRVLAEIASVDNIGSMGMSQGGGMSIWLGAWCERVKAVCADLPFLGGMNRMLFKHVYRYPLKELQDWVTETHITGESTVLHTLSYFDTLNLATRCRVPTHVSLGLKDPAVKPEQVRAIFEALPGEKVMQEYDWGHDWYPPMVENNRDWLGRYL